MILKQVIRYTNAPALEATWVRYDQLHDVDVPASPALYDKDGNEIQAAVEAHTRPGEVIETVLKCQAYSNAQMDMLRADLGADAAQYEDMIAEVASTYVPPEPQPIPVPQQITRAQGKAVLIMLGRWQAVLDYVASIQDPTQRALADVALNDTLTWERSSPFLNAVANGLGMTDEQLDALFIQAGGIAL